MKREKIFLLQFFQTSGGYFFKIFIKLQDQSKNSGLMIKTMITVQNPEFVIPNVKIPNVKILNVKILKVEILKPISRIRFPELPKSRKSIS